MKKIIVILSIILLTGCAKSIKCTNNIDSEVMKRKDTYKIYYEGDNITEVKHSTSFEIIDDNLKENFPLLFNMIKGNYDEKNISYDCDTKGDNYNIQATYIPSELDEEVLEEFSLSTSLNEYKQKLSEQGMECK